MQPTVFRLDQSKTRNTDLVVAAFCLWLGLDLATDFLSDHSDLGKGSWLDLAAAIVLGILAILSLAKIIGFEFPGWRWSRFRLLLDDDGLTYIRVGLWRPLRFSWADLSEIEFDGPHDLRRSSVTIRRDTNNLFLDWLTLDLASIGQKMRLPDIFDAPPKEIAATLNEYRDRALGGTKASAG